jgi:hypothetical protein
VTAGTAVRGRAHEDTVMLVPRTIVRPRHAMYFRGIGSEESMKLLLFLRHAGPPTRRAIPFESSDIASTPSSPHHTYVRLIQSPGKHTEPSPVRVAVETTAVVG